MFSTISRVIFPFLFGSLLLSTSVEATVVGATTGHFSVSGGTANYSIPLHIAPGRSGMQPDISLNYTGNGNGVLGVGWNIGGISRIHRCAATLAQDGFVAGINFTYQDRYCLDGQRLIPINGVNGDVGTEYRTEIDSYSRIISYGGSLNNPDYFVVTTKSGQSITFGGSANASLAFSQGTVVWSVREINDSTGNNAILYDYFLDQGTQYLNQIHYPGGQVDFQYGVTAKTTHQYFRTYEVVRNRRLVSISTKANGQMIRKYHMSYRDLGDRQYKVSHIQECNHEDSSCYVPLTFAWQYQESLAYGAFHVSHPISTNNYGDDTGWSFSGFADVNGDGLPDAVWRFGTNTGNYGIRMGVSLSQGDGTFGPFTVSYPITSNDYGADTAWQFAGLNDVNGDGLPDAVWHFGTNTGDMGNRVGVSLAQGNGTFGAFTVSYPTPDGDFGKQGAWRFAGMSDVNGDGLADAVWRFGMNSGEYGLRIGVSLSQGNGTFGALQRSYPITNSNYGDNSGWRFAGFSDTNGDGLADAIWEFGLNTGGMGNRIGVSLSLGDGTFGVLTKSYPTLSGNYGPESDWRFAGMSDTNGDGLGDAIWIFSTAAGDHGLRMGVSLSKGDATFASLTTSTPIGNNNYGPGTAWNFAGFSDVNGDGLEDAVWEFGMNIGEYGIRMGVSPAHGNGSFGALAVSYPITNNNYGDQSSWDFAGFSDVNGDGLADALWEFGVNVGEMGNRIGVSLAQATLPTLTDIQDSNGNVTSLNYQSLTNGSVYTKGTGSVYPIMDLQYPQHVISSVQRNNGVGGATTVNYQYHGLRTDLRGRGLHGFASITENYPTTGKTLTTYYDHSDFPRAGMVERITESYLGQIVNDSTKTYAVENTGGIYQLYLSQSVDTSYELNGNLINTVTTQNSQVDAYGNMGTVTVTTVANNPVTNTSETFVKTSQNSYSNDTNQWYLGRLTETTVTHQSPGQADQQRRSQFTYDNATGLLTTQSVVSIATGLPLTTTTNTYDSFGQKTQVTLSATGETNRTSTTTYNAEGKPTQVCNELNQCETYTYNFLGLLATTTGPNSITTTWNDDGFGRVIKETRADGTETSSVRHFASSGQCGTLVTHAYTCTVTQTTGHQPSTVQYDRLGREVRKITTGFDGRLVYNDTEYNHLAQVTRISRPYFSGDHIYWANSQYDGLSRVTQLDEPAPHGTRNVVSTAYNGLSTTVTAGAESRQKITHTNAIGQVVRREEEESGVVDYTYTADGNLKTTTVAGDSETTITLSYDEYGRKTGMDDPDMGVWSYSYNAFGELVSQTDAKNQTTTMAYDVLGRLTSRTDLAGTANAKTSTWTYGTAAAPAGSIGKLLSESDGTVTKTYLYDNLGRVDEVNSTLDVGTADERSFTAQTLYDNLGRVSRTIYPGSDNFYTENLYNSHGFLEKVRGLRSAAEVYDLNQLVPLVNEAMTLASTYQTRATNLKTLAQQYQGKIVDYQTLINSGTTSGEVDSGLQALLSYHNNLLNDQVNTAQTNPNQFYDHLNHTLVELQTTVDLLANEAQDYQNLVEELVVLTEQTLAAADNTFQYERTLVRGSQSYTELINDNQYTTYWRALESDSSGRVRSEVYGNGIVNNYTYNQGTGQLENIHSSLLTINPVRHLEYQYDGYQNVILRHDLVNDIKETFEYDRLDRLKRTDIVSTTYTSAEFNGSQTQTYDATGNITYKSDVGHYTYGENGAGPHALTSAGGNAYTYDANGNMLSGNGRTITWSAFNKPTHITRGTSSATFSYGPDRARYKKVNHNGDITRYVGKLYEHTTRGANTEEKHYVYANGQMVAEHIVTTAHGVQTRYLHKDALGSVDLVTDGNANVVDRRSFDAWGQLRNLTWKDNVGINDPLYLTQLPFTDRGFTGHEHVQEVGLIHMNGRVYDAVIARFLSADPFIQAPQLSQSYNRYTYVFNNPLKYNDPSGYLGNFIKKAFRSARRTLRRVGAEVRRARDKVKDVGVKVLQQISKDKTLNRIARGAACYFGGDAGCAAYDAATTYANTGSVSAGVGAGFRTLSNSQGGNNRSNFTGEETGGSGPGFTIDFYDIAASFYEARGRKPEEQQAESARETVATVDAGTSSETGGNKFANGAQTASMQYLFNQVANRRGWGGGYGGGRINLHDHENINGSHTIAKHVGKSEQQLLVRINESFGIGPFRIGLDEASSFSSLESANNLVSSVLSTNATAISDFLQSDQRTLVLNKSFGSITGRVAYRTGGNLFRPGRVNFGTGHGVRVVIRRNDNFAGGFNVHTAFPTRN